MPSIELQRRMKKVLALRTTQPCGEIVDENDSSRAEGARRHEGGTEIIR